MAALVIYFCAINRLPTRCLTQHLLCLRIHSLGRAQQGRLISAPLSVSWGHCRLGLESAKPHSPTSGTCAGETQSGLGARAPQASLSVSIWSLHLVCLACGFRATRFLTGWLRAPARVSKREPGEAVSFMTQRSPSIPSTSLRQSQGSLWQYNPPPEGTAARAGKSMGDWKDCCSRFGEIQSSTMGIIMPYCQTDLFC